MAIRHPQALFPLQSAFLRAPLAVTFILFCLTIVTVSAVVALFIDGEPLASGLWYERFAFVTLFFIGVEAPGWSLGEQVGPFWLLMLSAIRIIVPAIFVSILVLRLTHPPRVLTAASRLFRYSRNDVPVLAFRFYNRLPLAAIDVQVIGRLRTLTERPSDPEAKLSHNRAMRVETTTLQFFRFNLKAENPAQKAEPVEVKTATIMYPRSPMTFYVQVDDADYCTDENKFRRLQGKRLGETENNFITFLVRGEIAQTGDRFVETFQYRLSANEQDIVNGKFYDLELSARSRMRVDKPSNAVRWEGWDYFEYTQADGEYASAKDAKRLVRFLPAPVRRIFLTRPG